MAWQQILLSLANHVATMMPLTTEGRNLVARRAWPAGWRGISLFIIQTFVLEFFLTLLLMLLIIFVSQHKKWASATAIAVGGIVFLEAWLAGPFTGASMNPARSIAPELVSAQLTTLWIYILAPILGSLAAVGIWLFTNRK